MRVFKIGNSEVSIIEEALSHKEDLYRNLVRKESKENIRRDLEYEAAYIRNTKTLMKDQSLQELCEICLSYFWDRLISEGIDNPDIEWLSETMGITENELVKLFREAGFEEE